MSGPAGGRRIALHETTTLAPLSDVAFELDPASRSTDLHAELHKTAAELQDRIAQRPPSTGLHPLDPDGQGFALTLVDFTGTRGLLLDARANLAESEVELALAQLDELLADEPEHVEARHLRARCLYERGSGSHLTALRALGPLREETAGTDLAEAVHELRRELRAQLVPQMIVASCDTFTTEPDAAIAEMRELIDLAPEVTACYQALALALAIEGRPAEALHVAESGQAAADNLIAPESASEAPTEDASEAPTDNDTKPIEQTDNDTRPIEQLVRRLRLVLLRPLAAPAVSAYKHGATEEAAVHLRALDPPWRTTPVVIDFLDHLEHDVLPRLPAERASDVYSLIADNDVELTLSLIAKGRLDHAAAVLADVLPVVPGHPWLNFLYALTIYLRGGDTTTSSAAIRVALSDPDIHQATELHRAIRRQRENKLVNPAIEEFNTIVQSLPPGGSTREQLQSAQRELQAIAQRLPGLNGQLRTAEVEQAAKLLGELIERHLAAIATALTLEDLNDRFDQIMQSVTGPITSSAQAKRLENQLESLAAELRRQRTAAPVREHFDELADTLADTLRQCREVSAAISAAELIGQFNQLMESARHGVTPAAAIKLMQDVADISTTANALKPRADATSNKALDDLIEAAKQVMRQLT